MQWHVTFPEESVFVVRPSLIALCAGQRSAAKLLSALLYRCNVHIETQQSYECAGQHMQEDVCVFSRTQAQLVADLCGELSTKTLHDVAIPTLQLLGYLDLNSTGVVHRYTVYLERIRKAIQAYRQGPEQLTQVILQQVQQEKFRLDDSGENLLLDKKKFHLAVEKVRMQTRTFSPVGKGYKASPEAGSKALLDTPKNQREIQEKREEKVTASLLSPYQLASEAHTTPERVRGEVVATPDQRTAFSANTPAQRPTSQTPVKPEIPTSTCQISDIAGIRRTERAPHLTRRGQQVLAWYEAIRQIKVRPTAENIRASNGLGEMEEVTRENLEAVMTLLDHDPWLQARNLVVDLQELECPSSKFRFERILLAVKRRRARSQSQEGSPGAGSSPTALTTLPDYTHVQPEDLYIRA